jgi:hypothetical protein
LDTTQGGGRKEGKGEGEGGRKGDGEGEEGADVPESAKVGTGGSDFMVFLRRIHRVTLRHVVGQREDREGEGPEKA